MVDAPRISIHIVEKWQHTFTGIQFHDEKHNFLLYGGVDDIMIDEEDKLVVIDFKATAKKADILSSADVYNNGESYKRQLEVYSWLLKQNGFDLSDIGYLMYYNGDASKPHLGREMYFRRTLVPFTLDTSWIGPQVEAMYNCLQLDDAPDFNNSKCEDCLYLTTVSKL